MFWISQYKVDDTPIGEGGMGRILRGQDPEGNIVAIKEILPEFAADIEMRFRIGQEIHFLNRLSHQSIVKTYESFMLLDKYYIVMELVDGLNIEQWVAQNGVFEETKALDVMIAILDVMQFVHDKKVVHRDLKPSNIMLRRADESICLLDFGIAKDMSMHTGHTVSGSVIGSDGYMSPEQMEGYDIDYRSDIYALGCVFFYMLTGRHAYPRKESAAELMIEVLEKPFPKVSKYNKNVSSRLQKAIERATDKNMLRRFQSCREFAQELRNIKSPRSNPQPGTNVSPSIGAGRRLVTLGRENCDILFEDPYHKVSRRHAEIEFKSFTGGQFYIFRDDSANGSMVGGSIVHHMAYHIPAEGPLPDIYLACEPEQHVDWDEVITLLKERYASMQAESEQGGGQTQGPTGGTISDSQEISDLVQGITSDHGTKGWNSSLIKKVIGVLLFVCGFILFIVARINHRDLGIGWSSTLTGIGAGMLSAGFRLIRERKNTNSKHTQKQLEQ